MNALRRRPSAAFTLVELLAVIAILTLLISLLLPSLQRAREFARRAVCQVQMRTLCLADNLYHQDWRCYAPAGWGPTYPNAPPLYYWYEKRMMGKFFNEDVPRSATVDGRQPPKKSVLRCPSRGVSVWEDWRGQVSVGDQTWIAYNTGMSYQYGKEARGYPMNNPLPFWRGPKQEEIKSPLSKFVLFEDGRGSGFFYLCNWSNPWPDSVAWSAHVGSSSPAAFDPRHLGGCNYGFADGHANWFADGDQAFFGRQIICSPNDRSG